VRHGSLESGIGGFDYAAEQTGWENVFHNEINPFCRTILNYYWPKAKSYANVFGFNGYEWRGKVDIITGGFPCQPFSHAGKRKGTSDDRHIWPENMRIVREAQPSWCVFENVPGIINIENGMVFEQVCADLENEGYEVTPFIIPACATDKDHRRDRVWFVAYSDSRRWNTQSRVSALCIEGRDNNNAFASNIDDESNAANTLCSRQQGQGEHRRPGYPTQDADRQINRTINGNQFKETWLEAATRLCSVDDGFAGRLDTTSISKSKWRTESLKAYGNAIVWEVAFEIFKAIEKFNKTLAV
jgi:DNA (cytosine-5)-methyltransferase 1